MGPKDCLCTSLLSGWLGAVPSSVLSALRSVRWSEIALEGVCRGPSQNVWLVDSLENTGSPAWAPQHNGASNPVGFYPFLEKIPVNEGSQHQSCEIELK